MSAARKTRWILHYGDHVEIDLPGRVSIDLSVEDYEALRDAVIEQQDRADANDPGMTVTRIEYSEIAA